MRAVHAAKSVGISDTVHVAPQHLHNQQQQPRKVIRAVMPSSSDFKTANDNCRRVMDELAGEQASKGLSSTHTSYAKRIDNIDYRDMTVMVDTIVNFIVNGPKTLYWFIYRGRIFWKSVLVIQKGVRVWLKRKHESRQVLLAAWSLEEEHRELANSKQKRKKSGTTAAVIMDTTETRLKKPLLNSTDEIWRDHFKGWVPRSMKNKVLDEMYMERRAAFSSEFRDFMEKRKNALAALKDARRAARQFDKPITEKDLDLRTSPPVFQFETSVTQLSTDVFVRRAYKMDLTECAARVQSGLGLGTSLPGDVLAKRLTVMNAPTVRPPLQIYVAQIRSVVGLAPSLLDKMQKKGTIFAILQAFKDEQEQHRARVTAMEEARTRARAASLRYRVIITDVYYFGHACSFRACGCKMLRKNNNWDISFRKNNPQKEGTLD
eukprot:PhF_6_TR8740/c0_g1_i1/m.13752